VCTDIHLHVCVCVCVRLPLPCCRPGSWCSPWQRGERRRRPAERRRRCETECTCSGLAATRGRQTGGPTTPRQPLKPGRGGVDGLLHRILNGSTLLQTGRHTHTHTHTPSMLLRAMSSVCRFLTASSGFWSTSFSLCSHTLINRD